MRRLCDIDAVDQPRQPELLFSVLDNVVLAGHLGIAVSDERPEYRSYAGQIGIHADHLPADELLHVHRGNVQQGQ